MRPSKEESVSHGPLYGLDCHARDGVFVRLCLSYLSQRGLFILFFLCVYLCGEAVYLVFKSFSEENGP